MSGRASDLKAVIGWFVRAGQPVAHFVMTRVPVIALFFVGLFFVLKLLNDLSADTTQITNVGFGMSASLAALCFSCARAITDSNEDQDRFEYAGERFMHGAILLLIGSVLKYATLLAGLTDASRHEGSFTDRVIASSVLSVSGVLTSLMFFWAVSSAHGGLTVATRLLWKRMNRYSDWDRIG